MCVLVCVCAHPVNCHLNWGSQFPLAPFFLPFLPFCLSLRDFVTSYCCCSLLLVLQFGYSPWGVCLSPPPSSRWSSCQHRWSHFMLNFVGVLRVCLLFWFRHRIHRVLLNAPNAFSAFSTFSVWFYCQICAIICHMLHFIIAKFAFASTGLAR